MKKIYKTIVILSILISVSTYSAFSIPVSDTNVVTKMPLKINETYPWASTPFLSAGYGYPQGFRAETGYTFGYFLTLGVSFGIGDTWSRDPGEGTFAFSGRINIPIQNTSLGVYVSIVTGGNIAIMGESDSYTLVNLGLLMPLNKYLVLRPEIGIAFLSKHISGGRGLFGSSPEKREDKDGGSINIILELDIRNIIWSSWI